VEEKRARDDDVDDGDRTMSRSGVRIWLARAIAIFVQGERAFKILSLNEDLGRGP
jgi:hypothetical protein